MTRKINDKIESVRRRYPKRHATGFLYKGRYPARTKFSSVVMFAIFVSNEGRIFLREHEYKKKDLTPSEWAAWFEDHHAEILNDVILPTYAERFGGLWRLHTVIGFADNDSNKVSISVLEQKRNQTKRTRKKKSDKRNRR